MTLKVYRSLISAAAGTCVLAALALTAPAFADEDGDASAALPYPEGINCFSVAPARGFSVIDSKHLVIEGRGGKHYLATLYHRCFDLRTTFAIKLDSRSGRLCGPGDAVITGEDRCPIRYLEEVEDREEAETIVANRKAAAKEERENRSGDSQ